MVGGDFSPCELIGGEILSEIELILLFSSRESPRNLSRRARPMEVALGVYGGKGGGTLARPQFSMLKMNNFRNG